MESFWHDLNYALRLLRRSPGTMLAAILSLALGLGANTALFSVFDAVVLRPLPVGDPDRLVLFTWQFSRAQLPESHSGYNATDEATGKKTSGSFSYPFFQQVRAQNQVLSQVFAFYPLGRTNVQADAQSELASALLVSGGYFEGLGVRPLAGRLLLDSDDAPGASPAAVVSYAYWQKRFGADAAALGKSVFVNGQPFAIVGVAPANFYGTVDYTSTPEIFLPLSRLPQLRKAEGDVLADNDSWWFGIMGRLRPGVTREQAEAALRVPFQQEVDELIRTKNKKDAERPDFVLSPGRQGQVPFRSRNSGPLLYSLAVVGLVLLIACANVANLLLIRASARQREIAVRLALGAPRRRLIRQLLTESLLLGVLGGVAGVFIAWWGKEALFAWLPVDYVPRTLEIPLNLFVLGYSAALCLLTSIIFSLAPAFHATRVDLGQALKDAAGNVAGGRKRQWLGKSLVIGQVALSLMVLVAAGLFLRTLTQLERTPTGFDPQNLLTFQLDAGLGSYPPERIAGLYDEVSARVARLRGVKFVGTTHHPLITGIVATRSASFQDYARKPGEKPYVFLHAVSGEFFRALGAPLLVGRDFAPLDNENSQPVAIVNETIVRRYFNGKNPVGSRMDFDREYQGGKIEIIGVTRDMKYASLRDDVPPTVYIPVRQEGTDRATFVTFLVRAEGDPAALGAAVRATVRELDAALPVFGLQTQNALIQSSLEEERKSATLSTLFALLALVMAAIGLYGLLAHSTARRTNEIGIRMALGASSADILRMIVSQGMRLALLGVAVGLLGSYWATRLLESFLYEVKPSDPWTFAGAALVLAPIALFACWVPARRATRVNPTVALRYE